MSRKTISGGMDVGTAIRTGSLTVILSVALPAISAEPMTLAGVDDLTSLSLENLMDIEVYSVSKAAEPLLSSAAAVYVLTGEEIHRSGVRTVPEALRLIPGVNVARLNAHTWAVTTRGFNGTLVDKLEVLMDGRSLYTPLFSGVYWQQHNIPMGDIERIEVIRGPGAALWGSNAVNGVINIVTRKASASDPVRIEAGLGNSESSHLAASGTLALAHGAMRVYAREERFAENELPDGSDAEDAYHSRRLGMRSDLRLSDRQTLSLMAETYTDKLGSFGAAIKEENDVDYLLGRWRLDQGDNASLEISAVYQETRFAPPNSIEENRSTSEIEIKQQFALGKRHNLVAGIGYNYTRDSIDPAATVGFAPRNRDDETSNIFIQDQYEAIPQKLRLIAGIKAEDNRYSGLEIQPTLRFSFTPNADTTYWGAFSRAVRIPTRLDEDVVFYVPPPAPAGTVLLSGNEDFEAEELQAVELGYRSRLSKTLNLDVATYYNEYNKLRGVDYTSTPWLIINAGHGYSHGVESTLRWQPRETLSAQFSYTYQQLDYAADPGSGDQSISTSNDNDPRHQLSLQGDWQVRPDLNLNSRLRSISALDDRDVSGYTELDITLNWQLTPQLEASLLGQNLLHKQHLEFSTTSQKVEISRSVLLSLEWSF